MPGGYLVYGPPNEFPDPGIDAPYHSADDPHSAALILRTCLLMEKNSVGTSATNDALMQRSWDYLEMMWRTEGEMAFTWSPYPVERVWYAHMHGEIIETLVQCIKLAAYLPAGIPVALVKQRLLQTTEWIKTHGVESHALTIFDALPYRGYNVLIYEPNISENVDKVYARMLEEYDDNRALPVRYDTGGIAFPTHKFSWVLNGPQQRNLFYAFLQYVRGRQKAFWTPTWKSDFELVEDIAAGATTMKVRNVGMGKYDIKGERQHLVIIQVTSVGYKFTYRQILDVTPINAASETLTLDEQIFDGIEADSVAMICFMYLGRLDNDLIELKHVTDQIATTTTIIKAVWELRHV